MRESCPAFSTRQNKDKGFCSIIIKKCTTYLAYLLVLLAQVLLAVTVIAAPGQAQTAVGYWTFDDGWGTEAADSSGNGHTATLVNDVGWVTGKIGDAVSANAAYRQCVSIPPINLSGTQAVTVALWANRTYSTSGGHALFEATTNYTNSTTGFGFFPDDATCNGIQAALRGNLGYVANCYSQPSSGVWHHLAAVLDKSQTGGDEVKFYVDGVLQTANRSLHASTNTNNFGNNPIYLFSRAGTTEFTSGMIDDLRIYNRALTAEQIQQIYNSAGLVSIAVTPANLSIAAGKQQQFTATGTSPITLTVSDGGINQIPTGRLTVTGQQYDVGIDFRNTQDYVTDPAYAVFDNCVNDGTTPQTRTNSNGQSVTWQWGQKCNQAMDQTNSVDPRLAGGANVYTPSGGETLTITVPQAGTYNIGFATGGALGNQCGAGKCPNFIFKDGASGAQLFTVNPNNPGVGHFIDAANNNWTAPQWPASNQEQQVTLTGTTLTVSMASGNAPSIAHIRITYVQQKPNFTLSAAPASLSIAQGNQGISTITTTISGGFNSALSLSALGVPSGTTVSFNPNPIAAPGSGNSTMTITVGSSTPTGTYPITVVGNGGGVQQTTTVTLTVTAGGQPNVTLSGSPPSLSIVQGNHGTSTIATTISGGFNSAISLSATGTPTGTTVSFNPSTIAAPSSGNSTMTITVGSSTPAGTYPITVTGNGAGAQQNATVTLTVTAGGKPTFTISASPTSLTITQGNQGTSTITTAISGGFNSWIDLSAAGMPTGTTVSLNPSRLLAPGAGNSTMTITLGDSTSAGTYPITVTGNGGGIQQNATVSLTVTPSGGGGVRNGIIVYSTSGSTQTNRFVSIGRFFKQGDIPDFAQAVVGGTPLLTQCDVKNRWGDGSLKFGIISFIVPNVATGGTAVSFQDQATGNNTGYLAQGDMLHAQYDFDGVIQLTGTTSPSISARSMLQAGQFRYWLQGPIVTAVIIEDRSGRSFDVNTDGAAGNPLHPIFEAWFYPGAGCVSKGGCVELGITLENAWASSTAAISARNQTFGLTVTTGSAAPVTQIAPGVGNYPASFTQWAFTRWHRAFWLDTAPGGISIDYNGAYLVTTGAYPHYDLSWYPNGLTSYATAEYNDYTSKKTNYPTRFTIPGYDNNTSNGGSGMYDQALDSTGEPPDGDWKGLYPTWETVFLLTGDSRMIQEELDNADFAGRFPIWFREADNNAGTGQYFDYPGTCPPTNPSCTPGTVPTQGRVVSVNARQTVTLRLDDWRPGCENSSDDINAGAALSYGGWTNIDPSHFPDFAYVPYTLFGKEYYYEQEIMEAAYMVGNYPGCLTLSTPGTSYHQGWLGLQTNGSLTRAMAWGMRSIAYGAFIGLDGQPEAPYFRDKLFNSIAFLEGAWDVPLSITDTADRTTAWTFG